MEGLLYIDLQPVSHRGDDGLRPHRHKGIKRSRRLHGHTRGCSALIALYSSMTGQGPVSYCIWIFPYRSSPRSVKDEIDIQSSHSWYALVIQIAYS